MALIEGVGDEVTLFCTLLLLLSIVLLAWISTHTPIRTEQPHPEPPLADNDSASGPSPATPPPDTRDSTEEQAPFLPAEGAEEPASVSEATPTESPAPNSPNLRHRGPANQSEGASSAGSPDTIRLRLKFLNDSERNLTVRPSDSILHIKRTHFPGEESRVRLIYQGQLLRDDSQTVASLQLTNGCVLHCHISQHAPPPGQGGAELPDTPLNIGSLLVPLLVLIMALLWFSKLQHPHLYTNTATACLAAISLLVGIIAWATYGR